MDANFLAVVALIVVALLFDYINGFHDAANSIATVVSTRVLTPGKAVIWAAFFNFVAAFTFGTAVAKTVGSGLVDLSVVTFAVIFAGLMGAIIWDGVESPEVVGGDVAKIHVERLDRIGRAHEVALVEQPGVEAGDLVTGCSQDRDHLDTDVAEVPCH